MTTLPTLTPAQARGIALRAQGLHVAAAFGSGKEAALRALEHLGYVQIDTISVVQRAHHHVWWSRVPDYRPEWMDELIRSGAAYEYWSHAASILPMRDFRHSLHRMRLHRSDLHWSDDSPELQRVMRRMRRILRTRGPVRLRDFENTSPTGNGVWGFGKIERRALHELFMQGAVMIAGREGFEKEYDLRERVLPAAIDTTPPRPNEVADHVLHRTLRAHGLARTPEFHYLQKGAFATAIRARLARAVKRGDIVPVRVGEHDTPVYLYPETLQVADQEIPPPATAKILSPFDNLVIQRARLKWLFDFDYQIECYVPAARRKYGHFVLPVLWGDRFAARLEAKARRTESVLEVIGLWHEPGYERDRKFARALREELARFAAFNGCRTLKMNGI